jgi:hypothetical protein
MVRGKVLAFDKEHDGEWQRVGWMVAPSQWRPVDQAGMFAVTAEGYRGTMPLSVQVPPLTAGDYRVRLDLVRGGEELMQQRTATLYGFLRVLDSSAHSDRAASA